MQGAEIRPRLACAAAIHKPLLRRAVPRKLDVWEQPTPPRRAIRLARPARCAGGARTVAGTDRCGVRTRCGSPARCGASTGAGSTSDLWEALATLASIDLGAARAIEPHLDALAILEQAGSLRAVANQTTWGVFAAEGGGDPLSATHHNGDWRLSGTKPWCSLAGRLDRALVTAHLPEGGRGLFEVDLSAPGIQVAAGSWPSRGLSEIPSGPVSFVEVLAVPVGDADPTPGEPRAGQVPVGAAHRYGQNLENDTGPLGISDRPRDGHAPAAPGCRAMTGRPRRGRGRPPGDAL